MQPDELQAELLVALGSSRAKKLTAVLLPSSGLLRFLHGEDEKHCVSLGGATVTEMPGGRVELACSGATTRVRKSPRWNKKKDAETLVLWLGPAERDVWVAALTAACEVRKGSDQTSGSFSDTATVLALDTADQVRYLVELGQQQVRFWEEKGLRQLVVMVTTPGTAPEVALAASRMLWAESQLLSVKQAILSVEYVAAVARLFGDSSLLSQCAACYALQSILLSEEEMSGTVSLGPYCELMTSLLTEQRIAKALVHLLVLEEDNLPIEAQELVLRSLCQMSWLPDMHAALAGCEVLLRYLRVCLSLELHSPCLKLAVKVLGNLALLPQFREALSEEFDVSDVLLNLYCAAWEKKMAPLSAAALKALANVCAHPFIATQMVQASRASRLLGRMDEEGVSLAVLANVCSKSECAISAGLCESLVSLPVSEKAFIPYLQLLIVLQKRCSIVAALQQHKIGENVLQKYQHLICNHDALISLIHLQMLLA